MITSKLIKATLIGGNACYQFLVLVNWNVVGALFYTLENTIPSQIIHTYNPV